ncbi:MAG: ABC transporter, permease protein 1 (cluster 5, nickel/peptides/opines) [uncultured Nocardioidaceae bacterium]|uniref:ABC transporter, permease protein 1 (Cluster 5, nickel/peptides/opines) n=1 Tax=uncultured Nocardioidaceae bacterium TaxID=253824 RepID=A0A6J4MEK0_9ACTN|nr:MAG: ABC transporter, permease protein 1 (cluster 5, nickel/peptides/opines) [uncultured Nocardioidaceae bacterium]
MFGYIVRRVVAAIAVLIVTVLATYFFFYSGPADPARVICGDRCDPQRLASIEASLNLDEPKATQIADFFRGLIVGREIPRGSESLECSAPCLGYSFSTEDEVTDMIIDSAPVTISIAIGASLISLLVGSAIGIAASLRRGTATDKTVVGSSLLLSAIPYYIVALFTFLIFAVELEWFPRDGYKPLTEDGPLAWIGSLSLAWIALGLYGATSYARYSRGSMLEVLNEDFMRTARAKGLPGRTVTLKHGLRAALAPIATIYGLDLGILLAGTIFTEQIFGLQGIGYMSLEAVGTQDLPVLVGTVLFAATAIVIMNIITDVVYSLIDPRVRLA